MTHSNSKDESCAFVGMLMPALKGMIGAAAVMLALSVIFSGISLTFRDPDKAVGLFAYAALGVSSLLCGVFGMVSDEERRIVVPVISGALYVLVLVIMSLFVSSDSGAVPIVWRILAYATCILLSVLGGLAAGRRQKRSGNTKNPAALMRKRISGKK